MRNTSVKRISGYGVAVATVLSSISSKADVVFVDVNPDATGSNIANASVLLSFSLTGVVATDGSHVSGEQFSATHSFTAGSNPSSKLRFHGNGTTTLYGAPLAYGTLIGPDQTANPVAGSAVLTGFFIGPKGTWTAGQEAYIGLKFDNGGTPNFGWADITTVSPADITLHSFAYDNTGADIAAGIVPEPSQIALFALGAAGLVAYRRRKTAIAAK